MRKGTLALLAILFASQETGAEDLWYAETGYTVLSHETPALGTISPNALNVKLGRSLGKNIAAELFAATGVASDNATVNTPGTPLKFEVEVENYIGACIKGTLPVSDRSGVYAMLGYTSGKVKTKWIAGPNNDADDSPSFGAGGYLQPAKNLYLFAEWMHLFEGEAYEVEGASFGAGFHF